MTSTTTRAPHDTPDQAADRAAASATELLTAAGGPRPRFARDGRVRRVGEPDGPIGIIREFRTHEGETWAHVSFNGVAPIWLRAAALAVVPTVLPADGPDSTRFAWVLDGEMHTGTVAKLADWALSQQYGYDDGDPFPAVVYAPTDTGALAPVPVVAELSGWVDGWATLTVTVHMGNGVTAVGIEMVNGDV